MRCEWTAGKCHCKDCPMTLVCYVGGGMWICWLHALASGIASKLPPLLGSPRT